MAAVEHALRHAGKVAAAGVEDRNMVQPRVAGRRRRAINAYKGIQGDMVVIAACPEDRQRQAARRLVPAHGEPERITIEGDGSLQICDAQMGMADSRFWRGSIFAHGWLLISIYSISQKACRGFAALRSRINLPGSSAPVVRQTALGNRDSPSTAVVRGRPPAHLRHRILRLRQWVDHAASRRHSEDKRPAHWSRKY